jgi:DNA-binding NtrC family response regulator
LTDQDESASVLLVEDEVLVRLLIADELRTAGFTVLEAANADEAAAILNSRHESIGVVLTDVQMPGSIDGIGLVNLVTERYPHIRTAVLSGAHPNTLRQLKVDAVFTKPHHPAHLLATVAALIKGRAGNGSTNNNARRK